MPETTKKASSMSALRWIVLGFLVFYLLAYLTMTTTSSEDLWECTVIVKAIEAEHRIPPSLSAPGRPGVFCDKGVHLPFLNAYDTVVVYGVTDRAEQDAIIVTLANIRHESYVRKVRLQFIDKENWTTWSDPRSGRRGGDRGPESPSREVWIR
jgi:hypothetical protein